MKVVIFCLLFTWCNIGAAAKWCPPCWCSPEMTFPEYMVCSGLTITQFPLISEEISRGLLEIVISNTYMSCIPPPVNAQQYASLQSFLERDNALLNCSCLSIWKHLLEPQGTEFESECPSTTPPPGTSATTAPPTAEDGTTMADTPSTGTSPSTSPDTTAAPSIDTSDTSAPTTEGLTTPPPPGGGGGVLSVKMGLGIAAASVGIVGVGIAALAYLKGPRRCRRGRNPRRSRIYTGEPRDFPLQMVNHTYDESEMWTYMTIAPVRLLLYAKAEIKGASNEYIDL